MWLTPSTMKHSLNAIRSRQWSQSEQSHAATSGGNQRGTCLLLWRWLSIGQLVARQPQPEDDRTQVRYAMQRILIMAMMMAVVILKFVTVSTRSTRSWIGGLAEQEKSVCMINTLEILKEGKKLTVCFISARYLTALRLGFHASTRVS